MTISTFDLYKIGLGPSSSHTMGPMIAAARFASHLRDAGVQHGVARVQVDVFGSLAATGRGHATDTAILLGLEGEDPSIVDVDRVEARVATIRDQRELLLGGSTAIQFDVDRDIRFNLGKRLPGHSNGMQFEAFDVRAQPLFRQTFYSVGGGFVLEDHEIGTVASPGVDPIPFPFVTAAELLSHCARHGLSISELMLANERVWRGEAQIRRELMQIWSVMQQCVRRGCERDGTLPGALRVPRRAPGLWRALLEDRTTDPLRVVDWVSLFALAVNEENAAGGRVVTAPTNGAAGIIPAVLHYYWKFVPGANEDGVVRFLLTAAAIGVLFKLNASISGAEVGCQGEVGSACAMAAAALCEVLGGTPAQVENAAEIGIEHNLGLTCDPVGGLVQIPCIERNAVASIKAITAARLALAGDGAHRVSLDEAIQTMRDTGLDMMDKYKETSEGGLAVNVTEC